MTKLLAIDTATEQCSVALLCGDECIARCELTARGHSSLVLPMVQAVLAEAGVAMSDLDAIAFGRGPGAFTGVRIAIGVAQGLAFAMDLPLLGISDLAAVAQQAASSVATDAQLLVCMDARMAEVYTAVFRVAQDDLVVPVTAERVCAPELVDYPAADIALALGTGLRAYPQLRQHYAEIRFIDDALPRATEVARLALRDWQAGLAVAAELAAPVYLRDQVAHVKTT